MVGSPECCRRVTGVVKMGTGGGLGGVGVKPVSWRTRSCHWSVKGRLWSSATSSSRGGRRGARRGSGDEARIRARSEGFRRGAHREQDGEVAGGNGAATVANLAEEVLGGRRKSVKMASPRGVAGLN